jgi:hypothetical protein
LLRLLRTLGLRKTERDRLTASVLMVEELEDGHLAEG